MRNPDQQQLFTHYNPLEERLGADFFDELPQAPGVYRMFGMKGTLLYVGKAKNLRKRLFTYRRAKVGKSSRKTIRLVRMVHRIEYELCDSEKEALLLENRLIRNKQPEFNYAKKSPETYYFIHFLEDADELRFKLNMACSQDAPWKSFGAFKGHLIVRRALGSLLRLLYIAEHDISTTHKLPSILMKKLTPLDYRFPVTGKSGLADGKLLQDLFLGFSEEIFKQIITHFQEAGLLDRYIGKLILEDLEALKRFFDKCCRRNFEIAERFGLKSHIIPQQKLDDYLIELAFD